MADTKISAESSAGALTGAEIVPVVRPSGSPPTYSNLRTTTQDIANLGGGGGGLELISTLTANNTASNLAWTGLTELDYLIHIAGLTPATNGADILLQFGTGATPTWLTSASYNWDWDYWLDTGLTGNQNDLAATGIKLANAVDNSGGGQIGAEVKMFGLSAARRHGVIYNSFRLNGGTLAYMRGRGTVDGTTAKTAVRLITSSGNLLSGSASLYRYVP